jgi:trimeric autotransporter adhesin
VTEEESATGKIKQLRGVTWEWREEAPEEAKEQPGLGVIAQEVEKVFPELVETTPEGLKKVNYEGLIAPLIEAVKELDDRVRELERRLAGEGPS